MQRKLKFRVWDGSIYHYSSLLIPRNINGKGPNDYLVYNTDLVYQQFTGLFDKNNKEIYEGDIVRHDYLNFPVNGVVKWISESDGYDWSGWTTTKAGWGDGVLNTTIIGNIFENPELLS